MKKNVVGIIAVVAALLLVIIWAGHSSGKEVVEVSMEDTIDEDLIVVGVVQVGAESDWRVANTQSLQKAFTEQNGYYMIYVDAQQKQESQLKAIREFILQDVDYIVCAPIVESGWDAVLQEAKNAGIPVILIDRMVDVSDDSLYTCWVGSDFEREGKEAGIWLASYLRETGRSRDEINIVTLQGTTGASAQIGRTEGFDSVLKNHPNWNMIDMMDGDFTQAKGQEVMEYFLTQYDDIDVVISENDNMTFGAIHAIEEAGLTCGPEGDIIIVSFDAVHAALIEMIKGNLNVSVECNPLTGQLVSDIIQQMERGETPEKIVYVEEEIITSDEASELISDRKY